MQVHNCLADGFARRERSLNWRVLHQHKLVPEPVTALADGYLLRMRQLVTF